MLRTMAALLFATALHVQPCAAQTPGSFDGCPLEGKTTRTAVIALNRLKNRTVAPLKADVNPAITLTAVLRRETMSVAGMNRKPRSSRDSWWP